MWNNEARSSILASLAVDGSLETDSVTYVRTDAGINDAGLQPWWAVDLGGKYRIRRVRLTVSGKF